MEEKLKSILRQTHWSLVLKAVVFAIAWLAFPLWLFLPIALYIFFVPFSGATNVGAPFLVLLVLTFTEEKTLFFALVFAILFYYITLIKDLLIIDRKSAHEIVVLILSYLLLRVFFMKEGGDFGGYSLLISLPVAWLFAYMVSGFIKNFSVTGPDGMVLPEAKSFYRVIVGISFLLIWQLIIVGLFLPLDFFYQSAIIFITCTLVIDLIPRYTFGELSRKKTVVTAMVMFVLLVIILSSAHWAL